MTAPDGIPRRASYLRVTDEGFACDTDDPLENTAADVGYTSVYAFSRAFHRERSLPPGAIPDALPRGSGAHMRLRTINQGNR